MFELDLDLSVRALKFLIRERRANEVGYRAKSLTDKYFTRNC